MIATAKLLMLPVLLIVLLPLAVMSKSAKKDGPTIIKTKTDWKRSDGGNCLLFIILFVLLFLFSFFPGFFSPLPPRTAKQVQPLSKEIRNEALRFLADEQTRGELLQQLMFGYKSSTS